MTPAQEFHRRTYYETDEFRIWLEEIKEQLVVHVVIYNPSKDVIKQIKKQFGELLLDAFFDGYEELFTYTKDPRIVNLVGGATKIGEHQGYEVYKWELK